MEWVGLGVLLSVTVGATVQIITGTGFALVCAPLLLLLLGQDVGVRAVLLLSLALNTYLLAVTVRFVRWKDSALLLASAALFVVPTAFAVQAIRGPVLTVLAGAVIVVAVVLVMGGRTFRVIDTAVGAALAGAVSGIFTVVAAVSGPPITLLAVQRKWPPAVTRGTMQAFFLPLNMFALAVLGPVDIDLTNLWWAVGGCVCGVVAGTLAARRIPPATVQWSMLVVAAVGGAWLIVAGVSDLGAFATTAPEAP